VIATTIDLAEIVREGHAVLHVAMEGLACEAVEAAMVALDDALDTYGELAARALHWSVIWPHLRGEADPDEAALRKAAEEIEAAAQDLIKVIAAHSGTEDETNAAGKM
jgi:hypothetical protein